MTGGSPGYCYAGANEGTDYFAFVQGQFSTTRHFAEVTIRRAGSYNPGVSHEVEVHVGGTVSPTSALSYEFDLYVTGELQVIRWDDPLGGYDVGACTLVSGTWATSPLADGDVVRVEFDSTSSSPVMTIFRNGVQQAIYTDVTGGKRLTGSPGWAHFFRPGATQASYGIKQFRAGNL